MVPVTAGKDVVCFSSYRWHSVWQRSQHLLSRAARDRRVWFVEAPVGTDRDEHLAITAIGDRLSIVVPHVPHDLSPQASRAVQHELLTSFWRDRRFDAPILWYTSATALPFTRALDAGVVVYDCMEAPSLLPHAPAAQQRLERELLDRADLVFTGGVGLFEAMKDRHRAVHAFPGSVDRAHFARARTALPPPEDQAGITGPRVGMIGVVDERLDTELLGDIATLRPDYQFVVVGPIARSATNLPTAPNLHYLGMKPYEDLPAYLAGWDVAILPFARNDATRFISPTSVPEYLAAGRPVVATSITDVVRPYGVQRLVRIADEPLSFAQAIDDSLADRPERLAQADAFLAHLSWDRTWQGMHGLIGSVAGRTGRAPQGRAVSRAPVGTIAAGPAA